ncbi:hypothetical protein WDZ17_09120 [Pseudokineococcus basanitobsidens]|uniref:Uncharacterized protein n=1 Tax=Pseudokineococcus basanitobsidens TaxID=1926649 RepID=A0ABU8RK72_9ACTN
MAEAVLDAAATQSRTGDLRLLLPGDALDDVDLTRDEDGRRTDDERGDDEPCTTVTVTAEQVQSARVLGVIAGGPDKVDPLIATIASAAPRRAGTVGYRAS